MISECFRGLTSLYNPSSQSMDRKNNKFVWFYYNNPLMVYHQGFTFFLCQLLILRSILRHARTYTKVLLLIFFCRNNWKGNNIMHWFAPSMELMINSLTVFPSFYKSFFLQSLRHRMRHHHSTTKCCHRLMQIVTFHVK